MMEMWLKGLWANTASGAVSERLRGGEWWALPAEGRWWWSCWVLKKGWSLQLDVSCLTTAAYGWSLAAFLPRKGCVLGSSSLRLGGVAPGR